jgi:hypothetical protein
MTLATNTIDSSPSLPTLASIQHRRRELLAFQAWQRPAQATAPPGEPLAAEESCLEEESCLAQEPDELHPAKDPEPSPDLPSQASACPRVDGSQPCGPQSKTPKPPMRGLNAHSALKEHTSPRTATGN